MKRIIFTLAITTFLTMSILSPAVLAEGIVNSCDDTSLRAALLAGGEVTLNCSGMIAISDQIDIEIDTTIIGTGQNVALSGSNTHRIFLVRDGISLTLRDLTMQDGMETNGGAILNLGSLVAENVTFSNNHSNVGIGGAIHNDGGSVILRASTFDGNSADNGGSGGAIANSNAGELTIQGGTFNSNQASSTLTGRGGAIFGISGRGTIDITGATFTNNFAMGVQEGGGAIYDEGPSMINISDSTFTNNAAPEANGGAVYLKNATSETVIHNTLFELNQAPNGNGGAIFGASGAKTEITESTFLENSALEGGGIFNSSPDNSVLTIIDTTFEMNDASHVASVTPRGGGAISNDGKVLIFRSTFLLNTALDGSGGALHNNDTVVIVNSTFVQNNAEMGGAILNTDLASLKMSYSTLNDNFANNAARGGGIDDGNTGGGAIKIKDSIIANSGGADCNASALQALGTNFSTDGTCLGFDFVTSEDLRLGSLMDNRGLTESIELQPGSVAIDAADDCVDLDNNQINEDQREVPRAQGSSCDVGSYETATQPLDVFVDFHYGSDSNDCRSAADACGTLQGGIDKASATATVHVLPGSTIEKNVKVTKAITIQGETEGTNQIVVDSDGDMAFVIASDNVTINGITFENFGVEEYAAVVIVEGQNIFINENAFIDKRTHGISVQSEEVVVNIDDNWWGCNAGPEDTDNCVGIKHADINTWLTVAASADPEIITGNEGPLSTITVEVSNNAGAPVFRTSAMNGRVVDFVGESHARRDVLITDGVGEDAFQPTTSGLTTIELEVDNESFAFDIAVRSLLKKLLSPSNIEVSTQFNVPFSCGMRATEMGSFVTLESHDTEIIVTLPERKFLGIFPLPHKTAQMANTASILEPDAFSVVSGSIPVKTSLSTGGVVKLNCNNLSSLPTQLDNAGDVSQYFSDHFSPDDFWKGVLTIESDQRGVEIRINKILRTWEGEDNGLGVRLDDAVLTSNRVVIQSQKTSGSRSMSFEIPQANNAVTSASAVKSQFQTRVELSRDFVVQKYGTRAMSFSAENSETRSIGVEIFSLAGKSIFSDQASGQTLMWRMRDANGSLVANGVYLYVVTAVDGSGNALRSEIKKFVVMR